MKAVLAALMMLVVSVPAQARPRDVYPVSCDVLWTAIKVTLSNVDNYTTLAISDTAQNAAFLVVGEMTPHTDRVALLSNDIGCAMKLAFLQIGPDNANERGFRKRVMKALAKIEAEIPAAASAKGTAAPGHE
jgi:hypothetical protein